MMPSRPGRVRAALFVDFDNLYLGLEAADARAAKYFAEQPMRWMNWLERGCHTNAAGKDGRTRRSVLLRNCYLGPGSASRFRNFLARGAFSLVDCPPQEGADKTNVQVRMAMDIMDALAHPTPFDEFIVLAPDVDLLPLLQRLRAHDRRTAVLAGAAAAPALAAACTFLVDQAVFIETALGDTPPAPPPPLHAVSDATARAYAPRPFAPRPFMPRPSPTGDYAVLPEVAAVLHESIEQDGPIPAAELPHFFFRFANFRNSDWFGFRSLRRLAEALTTVDPMLECGEPGEEWQMALREEPLESAADAPLDPGRAGAGGSDGLAALIATIHQLLGVPALGPDGFDLLFEHMAKLFDEGVTDRVVMSRMLRERVGEEGVSLALEAAEFVTAGLWQSGFDAGSDASDPDVVAKAFRDYVVVRCEQARHPLNEEELALVDEWLVGA